MILGYSHVTLSSADLDRDAAWLTGIGFERRFTETGLINSPPKRPYLDTPAETMSMTLCGAPASMAVELVAYERWAASAGRYELLLEVPDDCPIGDLRARDYHRAWGDILSRDVVGGPAGSMNIPLSFTRCRGRTGGVLSIRSVTEQVGRELDFWCGVLGCRRKRLPGSAPAGWAMATFASPLPQWSAHLVFCEGDPGPHPQMDSPGTACLSVLVRQLDRTAESAVDAGALSVSDPFAIEVDARPLRLAIVRTPGGAIVELMEYQSPRSVPTARSAGAGKNEVGHGRS